MHMVTGGKHFNTIHSTKIYVLIFKVQWSSILYIFGLLKQSFKTADVLFIMCER